MNKKKIIARIISYLVLVVFALTTLFPFYLMIVMGTHTNEALFTGIKLFFGKNFVSNWQTLMKANFLRFFSNSLIIALPNVLLTLLSCAMGGYALSKFNFKGKKIIQNFVFITIMLPGGLGLIAWVWQMKQFGWINSYLPFIIPAMGNTYGVFWMSQYAKDGVPKEVIESSKVDGANESRIFFQIVIPFLFPAMISLGLLQFVGSWNNYIGPLIILRKPSLYTVPIGIATLGSLFRVEYSARILGMTIATLPLLTLFSCTSKYFMMGMASGAVKE